MLRSYIVVKLIQEQTTTVAAVRAPVLVRAGMQLVPSYTASGRTRAWQRNRISQLQRARLITVIRDRRDSSYTITPEGRKWLELCNRMLQRKKDDTETMT